MKIKQFSRLGSSVNTLVYFGEMCDTPTTCVVSAGDAGTAEGGGGAPGLPASSSRASPTGRARPKHPYGRRNTYIGTYLRHGLGYGTVGRDESLTKTKFRDLSSRERRLYTLSLGYGLREDSKSVKRKRKPEMSRGHAVALMARLQEMMLHEGRTVEGIFAALRLDTRCDTCFLHHGRVGIPAAGAHDCSR